MKKGHRQTSDVVIFNDNVLWSSYRKKETTNNGESTTITNVMRVDYIDGLRKTTIEKKRKKKNKRNKIYGH